MNYFIIIDQDEYAGHPRDEFDHIGTMYIWHRKYTLGGKDDENNKDHVTDINVWIFDNFNEVARLPELEHYNSYDGEIAFLDENETQDTFEISSEQRQHFDSVINQWKEHNLCIIPIYMYDHSGITISSGPFHCPWDSGQVGFIYVTKETCDKHQSNFADAEQVLIGELKELDCYLTGDVYQYTIWETEEDIEDVIYEDIDDFEHAEIVESCSGFYGYDYCKESALSILKAFQQANEKDQLENFDTEMYGTI